jgi:hypothetical protein
MIFPLPIEGIDKIKVLLHPVWYHSDMWNYTQPEKTKCRIDPKNQMTLHQAGMFISLAIHAEFFDPMEDYYTSVVRAVYKLIEKKIITFPNWPPFTQMFVLNNLNWFVVGVQEAEFYFNIRPKNIVVTEDAVETGSLTDFKGSLYTTDHHKGKNKRDSVGIIYDKEAKDRKDNHIKHKTLEQYPYKTRLEFRLATRSCQYLNLENFKGIYHDIIKRWTPYLAIQFAKWFGGCVEINGRDNKRLKRIVKKAESCGTRYRGDELKKSSAIKVEEKALETDGRKQMQRMLVRQFHRERKDAEKGQE